MPAARLIWGRWQLVVGHHGFFLGCFEDGEERESVTKSPPSPHAALIYFPRGNQTRSRGEEKGGRTPGAGEGRRGWPPAPRGAAPRALAPAERVQRLSPALGCAALIEAQPFTLIAQRGTRGAGELFDPLPRCCLSVQPLALEGWITRPSLFPVNYSRYRGSSCEIDRKPPKGTQWLTKQTARSRLPSPSPTAPTPQRARGHPGQPTCASVGWEHELGPRVLGDLVALRGLGANPPKHRPQTHHGELHRHHLALWAATATLPAQYNPVQPSKTL